MENLHILEKPSLSNPRVVAGFSGWANAGEISTGPVGYLKTQLRAVKYAEIQSNLFYDFTNLRPSTFISKGVVKRFNFVGNEFFCSTSPDDQLDVILFLGAEPHLRWQEYVQAFFAAIEEFQPSCLYLLGSYYDSIPHSREPGVSASVTSVSQRKELEASDLQFTDYQGPTGIHSMLQHACSERGLPSVSIWCGTPHYLPTANPKAWRAVLARLTPLLGIELNTDDLDRRVRQLEKQIAQALSQNPKLRQYVEQLEQSIGVQEEQEPLQSDEIIRSLEEFLRKKQQEDS